MAPKINLNKKLNFNYKSEDFIPFFLGFKKRVDRIVRTIEENPLLEKEHVKSLRSSAGYNKGSLFLQYHVYTSGAALVGIGAGLTYAASLIFNS
jgi:hypothetical protein